MLASGHRIFWRILCAGVVLALAPPGLPGELSQSDEPGTAQGLELFQIYCSNCHGKRGHGDGPTAEVLTVVPANLTRLARLNKGEFPSERVYKSIDGRGEIRGHGRRRMPIWGLAFQEYDRDTNQEAGVRFRIQSLVEYLQSIQE